MLYLVKKLLQVFKKERTTFAEPKSDKEEFANVVNFFEPTDIKRAYDNADSVDDFLKGIK